MTLTLFDEFCGFGGSSQGAEAVPGIEVVAAANHLDLALEVHGLNFPNAEHLGGDITKRTADRFYPADLFWASPACPPWTDARGKRRDFDKSTQELLFDDETEEERREREELAKRRALMEEIPRYLRAMSLRGRPVLAGVVENVIQCRKWDQWHRWLREIEHSDRVGYSTRVIAVNSMHVKGIRTRQAPQSRDRLYVAYWHRSIGRDPDWDRWLRPRAWCSRCDEEIDAVQVFKRAGIEMGRYGVRHGQYVYRCPRSTCRNTIVEPWFEPAVAAIDWTIPGQRIGDRDNPLKPKTHARVGAGIRKHARPFVAEVAGHTYERRAGVRTWPVEEPLKTLHTTATKALAVPMLVPAGGTWRDAAQPLTDPMPTRTTRESDALVVPMLVPTEARDGIRPRPVDEPMRTQTARNETAFVVPPMVMRNNTPRPGKDGGGYLSIPVDRPLGALTTAGHQSLIVPPFIAELRGGGSGARAVTQALATVTASGNHHALVTTAEATMAAWAAIYAYDAGDLRDHLREPLPTQTTVAGDALLTGDALGALDELGLPDVDDCYLRMLEPHEIAAGMAFFPDYRVKGNKRQQVRGYGNAVTPNVSEVLWSALVECVTGEPVAA